MNPLPVSDATTFSIPDHVIFREAGEESVLLNLESEEYFGLDGVGNQMWALVRDRLAFGEIVARISRSHDVDEAAVEADLRDLVSELADHGLISLDG